MFVCRRGNLIIFHQLFFPFTLREGPREGGKGRGSEEIRVGGGGSLCVMGEHGGPLCPLFDLSL